jgi:catechol 2,3-dioxygenase-like lactoylglutathione lyase family enzyme
MGMELTHVRLLVVDFPACYRFYRDVLGLSSEYGDESGVYADFVAGPARIALFKRDLMADSVSTLDRPATADCQDRVAFIIGVPDVDAAHAMLESRGAKFVNPPHDRPDWGSRCLHLRDPDGNLIEIYHEIPFEPDAT